MKRTRTDIVEDIIKLEDERKKLALELEHLDSIVLIEDIWKPIIKHLTPESAILLALVSKSHLRCVKAAWSGVKLLFLQGCKKCGSNNWIHSCNPRTPGHIASFNCLTPKVPRVIELDSGYPCRIECNKITSFRSVSFRPVPFATPDAVSFTIVLDTPIHPSWGSGYTGDPICKFKFTWSPYIFKNKPEWFKELYFYNEKEYECASGIFFFCLLWEDEDIENYIKHIPGLNSVQ